VRDRQQRLVEFVDRDPDLVGDLLVGRRTLQLVLELRVRALELACARA
jgi:hypothetical protein